MIFDAWGKMEHSDIRRLLKKGGTYASPLIMPTSFFSALFFRLAYGKKFTSSNMRSRPEDYAEIEKLFSERKLRPVIENRFPLEHADEAFDMTENGKPRGKVIVVV